MKADGSLSVGSPDPSNPQANAGTTEARLQELRMVLEKSNPIEFPLLFQVGESNRKDATLQGHLKLSFLARKEWPRKCECRKYCGYLVPLLVARFKKFYE